MIKTALKYRLQPLLDLKVRAKQKAEILLAKAIAQLEAEKKRLKKLEEEKREIIQKRKEVRRELHERLCTGHAKVKESHFGVNYLKRLEEDEKQKDREIEQQHRTIQECETQVKRARREYIDAAKELKVMEKHKELWRKKARLFLNRKEENEMDELGNVIHQLKHFHQGEVQKYG
ncbi:MAG: flagellar FliJ family protein [Deltaproteobacteria bacterium]|nr:flagellar FliJ family protein [Deltaproteobacteria bacterium]